MAAPRLPQRGRKKELPPWCDFTACPAGLSPKQLLQTLRFLDWTQEAVGHRGTVSQFLSFLLESVCVTEKLLFGM